MNRRAKLFWLLGAYLTIASQHAAAQTEELRLARFPKSPNQFVASQIITEVYRQAGLTAKVVPMPPPRSAVEALGGQIDGEVSRLRTHVESNPGLVLVTPSFDYFTMRAFSKLSVAIRSADDLKNYRVGIIRGVQASMDLTREMDNVQAATNSESLMLMLAAGRFDVAIDVDINGEFQIKKHGLKDVHPVGDLLQAEVFNILAPGRANLEGRISASITRMKKSGELAKLKKRFNREFVEKGLEPD